MNFNFIAFSEPSGTPQSNHFQPSKSFVFIGCLLMKQRFRGGSVTIVSGENHHRADSFCQLHQFRGLPKTRFWGDFLGKKESFLGQPISLVAFHGEA
jgi:hypothetical protein